MKEIILLADALKIKADALTGSVGRGNPADDMKSAAGEIYTKLKQLLSLQRAETTLTPFMRDTLAPLITPSMSTYAKLKVAIVDKYYIRQIEFTSPGPFGWKI